MSGTEAELLAAAVSHAVSVHGHQDAPELPKAIRSLFQVEALAG